MTHRSPRGALFTAASLVALLMLVVLVGGAPDASAAPPANDNLADAVVIGLPPFADTFDPTDASSEVDEPGFCFPVAPGFPGPPTAWYRYTAQRSIALSVDVSTPGETAVLGVYGGG